MRNSSVRRTAAVLLALASTGLGSLTAAAQETDPSPDAQGDPVEVPSSGLAAVPGEPTPPPGPTPEVVAPPNPTQERPDSVGRPELAAPPPAATPSPEPTPPSASSTPLSAARVQVYVDRAGAWLELRDDLAGGPWERVCNTPCDQVVVVEGRQARLNGPLMTPSNVFRIEPGTGAARFKARAGSASARRWGTILLATGLPLTSLGFAGYGYSKMADEPALGAAGAIVLGAGATAVVLSLVLVSRGSTRVRDARGHRIAAAPASPRF